MPPPADDNGHAKVVFDLTRWDLIRLAKDEDPADYTRRQSERALNQLCQIYRAPVLAYISRRVVTPHDAEDLAQEFFTQRICSDLLGDVAADKGRFGTLLLISLKNFIRDQTARGRTEKRGGKVQFVPIEEAASVSDDDIAADDRWFDACWARTVVERALIRVRQAFGERGDTRSFDILSPFVGDPAAGPDLDEAAAQLGISVNALHARVSRLRALYARCVREELACTVQSEKEIELEVG